MKKIPDKLFVDTNIFLALRDKNDPTHKEAKRLLSIVENQEISLYTSSDVIGETLTLISRKLGKAQAREFSEEVENIGQEIFIDEKLHQQARKLFFEVRSKNISFIDCSSAVAMKKNKIPVIFSFDKHFKTLGVRLLGEAAKN